MGLYNEDTDIMTEFGLLRPRPVRTGMSYDEKRCEAKDEKLMQCNV